MTDDEREIAPWPAWVRYTVYVVGIAVVGVALVTLLYDRGVLPVAGIFAALFVAPVFVRPGRGIREEIARNGLFPPC